MVRTLLALDLGLTTAALTRAAAQASVQSGSEIVIAHALSPLSGQDFRSAQCECLDVVRKIQVAGGCASETLIIRVSEPEDLILTSVGELDVSLVVMGWGWGRQLGPTVRGVLRAARCSLLLVGEQFLGPLRFDTKEGFELLSIQDLAPLARLASVASQLPEVSLFEGLFVELKQAHSLELLSRGVAS